MRISVVAAASFALLVACKKEQPAAPAPPVVEQKPVVAVPEQAPDAGGPLGLDEVDKWIAYRKELTAVHKRILPELDKLDAKKSKDGGSVAEAGLKLVGEEAKAKETAQKSSGLSQARLDRIEERVRELVTEREMAEDTGDPKELAEMEALAKKSSAEQKASLEKSIAELKAQRERSMQLTDMRNQYGSADVDVLLQREKEVTATWNDWMAALAGEAK
ncbi:MAG: hypothetical protein ACJ790_01015 [Myxococcaceae bacterium]